MSLRELKGSLTLEQSCMNTFNRYLLAVVRRITEKCFLEPSEEVVTEADIDLRVQPIKDYLLAMLHPVLIDTLLSNLDASDRTNWEKQVILEIFMHENMVRFNPTFRVATPSPAEFYESKIAKFANIVQLTLKMVATDSILAVVGRSCPNIEIFDIVSKIGTLQKSFCKLNALRLEYFVSDEGLRSLHSCQKLRRIIMRKVYGSNCGGKHVTYDGIRGLLKALPKLQYIRFNNMGYVLNGMNFPANYESCEGITGKATHFNLLQLHDDQTCVEHIEKIGTACPKLKTLCLNVPPTFLDKPGSDGQCLEHLAQTRLNLVALSLRGFFCNDSLTNYCRVKGETLCHLKLHCAKDMSLDTLINIGWHCPNIVSLDYLSAMNFTSVSKDDYLPLQGLYFHNLEVLTIMGQKIDLDAVLTVCCHGAEYLRYIEINSYGNLNPTHNALGRLMGANQLGHLKFFSCCGFEFNLDHLLQFLLRTTTLKRVCITERSDYDEFLKDVKVRYNLHYKTNLDSMPPRTSCYCVD